MHNVTRMALLFSVGRAAEVLKTEECADIRQKLLGLDGSTEPALAERQRFKDLLEQIPPRADNLLNFLSAFPAAIGSLSRSDLAIHFPQPERFFRTAAPGARRGHQLAG